MCDVLLSMAEETSSSLLKLYRFDHKYVSLTPSSNTLYFNEAEV